jgi:hypothetical protein
MLLALAEMLSPLDHGRGQSQPRVGEGCESFPLRFLFDRAKASTDRRENTLGLAEMNLDGCEWCMHWQLPTECGTGSTATLVGSTLVPHSVERIL